MEYDHNTTKIRGTRNIQPNIVLGSFNNAVSEPKIKIERIMKFRLG